MQLLRKLWKDEAGFVVSAELVLVATIMVIGLIVGMTVLRNQIVQELADVGQAFGHVSQGYNYVGTFKGQVAQTDGSGYDDKTDFCQGNDRSNLEPGSATAPMLVHGTIGAANEVPEQSNAVRGED
jgi:Flp pilus assembly pilin Flp